MIAAHDTAASTLDPKLVDTLRKARHWLDLLTSGTVTSIDAIAELEGIPASEISRILPLAFLAPEITKSILMGNQPIDLTAEQLKRMGKMPAN